MLKWKKRKVIFLILTMMIASFGIDPVHASDESYQKDFNYANDRVMDGIYGEETLYFQIPNYWQMEQATAHFTVRLSPMLVDIPASLTFLLNDQPIQSVNLNYADGQRQEFIVPLSAMQLQQGYNRLSVTGNAQIYDEQGCLDEFSGANWIIVEENSGITVQYQLKEPSYTIAEYPYPLLSSENATGAQSAIVVPDEMTSEELTAATWIKIGLAKHCVQRDDIQILTQSAYEDTDISAVIISLYDQLSPQLKENIEQYAISENDLQQQALIMMEPTETGQCRVVITSKNPDCLVEAAQLLLDENRTSQEHSSLVFVAQHSADQLKAGINHDVQEFKLADWSGNTAGSELHGAFRQEQVIYPPTDEKYILSPRDRIHLNFRYSENLDFNRSLLTVSVNGQRIGSKKLEQANAGNDVLELKIPADLSGQLLKSVTLSFDLEIQDLVCTVRNDEMPWAFVSADSSIFLAGLQNGVPSFDIAPWPFVKKGFADTLCFALPKNPTIEDLGLLGQLASLYGTSMKPYGDLEVVIDANEKDVTDKNVILIGTFQDQLLLSKVKQDLPFSINDENTAFLGNEMFAFSNTYAKRTAAMQLIRSPFDKAKTWLVATAPDHQILTNLSEYLADLQHREELKGDALLVDTLLQMRSFTFQKSEKGIDEVSLRERIEENKEPAIFALIGTAVMILLLLSSILILLRAHAVNKKGR